MANYYETLFIIRPNADDDTVQAAVTATRDHIAAAGGEVLFETIWGKRKLAYEVDEYTEGVYAQINFTAAAGYPPQLERMFRLSDDVIRDLVIKTEGPPPPADEMPRYLETGGEAGRGREEEPGGPRGERDRRADSEGRAEGGRRSEAKAAVGATDDDSDGDEN